MMLPTESTARLRSSKPPVELNVFGKGLTGAPLAENFSKIRSENQVFSARTTLPLASTAMDRICASGVVVKCGLPFDHRLVSLELLATSTLRLGSVAMASTALVSLRDWVQSGVPFAAYFVTTIPAGVAVSAVRTFPAVSTVANGAPAGCRDHTGVSGAVAAAAPRGPTAPSHPPRTINRTIIRRENRQRLRSSMAILRIVN